MSAMATDRIRKGARGHLYLDEWFERRDMNDEKVANRLGVARQTIWKWRKHPATLGPDKLAKLAFALDCEPIQLWGPPARPSLDVIMMGEDDDTVKEAAEMLAIFKRRGRG